MIKVYRNVAHHTKATEYMYSILCLDTYQKKEVILIYIPMSNRSGIK